VHGHTDDSASHDSASHDATSEPVYVASTDGVRVASYDFGGHGPLLVLCHATGFCAGVWQPIARRLADRFHCVGLDFRGHGRTGRPDHAALVWTGMGQDLLAVIDHALEQRGEAPGTPVFAAGHSMGGASIVLAELSRPGTIAKAWALEPILFPTPDDVELDKDMNPVHESPLVAGARRRRPEFESREAAFERYASRPPFSEVDPEALRAYVDQGFRDLPGGGIRLRCEPESEAEVFEHSLCGAYEHLAEIQFPFLVAASGDGEPPALITEDVVEQNPRFVRTEYTDLTHFAPLEDPERMAHDIAAWFTTES